jgi:hypothetical protein
MKALIALAIVFALPAAAQNDLLFPRFSLIAGSSPADFETNLRVDPDDGSRTGTLVSFERDLGLEETKSLPRFRVQWRPLANHELSAAHFSASRSGAEQIDRDIVFRDDVYPVQAFVTTQFDLDSWSATYSYWPRRSERAGIGITLGAATLSMKAAVTADTRGGVTAVSQEAETDVPVALAGVEGRIAFTSRLHGEVSIASLPRVTIEDSSGSALTGTARLEFRPLPWLGIGAAYNYFRLDVDVAAPDLGASLDMTVRGPEGYVRFAF